MNDTKTLATIPLLQTTENFLTLSECQQLIDVAKLNLKTSSVINGHNGLEEISNYRTSSNYRLPSNHELTSIIYDKISSTIGIDSDKFENIEIIKYESGELFDVHVDYFMSNTEKKHFLRGGQRIGTVILYLNEVESGGETFFPRLRIVETPKTGKMAYFKYDYDDDVNTKTHHKAMPILSGKKWIATVWIREFARTKLCDNVVVFKNSIINDTIYELECSVPLDFKTMTVTLLGNFFQENTIIVHMTPDKSSWLLLYLLTSLNLYQSTPYFILPIIVGNYHDKDSELIFKFVNNVREKTSSEYLLNPEIYYDEKLIDIFMNKCKDIFYKFSYLFTSDINNISDGISEFIIRPFENLDSIHLEFAIRELDLSD